MRVPSLALALIGLASTASGSARVVLVSWDGAGYAMTSRLLAEGRLPNLARVVREGAWSDGMVTSFPTKTAAAHAILFTGHYGHRSGITGNDVLRLPAQTHSRLEKESGYFSSPLRVEPVWVQAARAGRSAYVFHGTQAYPFDPLRDSLRPRERESLFVAYGYTDVQLRGVVLDPETTPFETPSPRWNVPEASAPEARAITFEVGETAFHGLFFDDPFDPTLGRDTLGIVRGIEDTEFLARVKPGNEEDFSVPVPATASGRTVWFSLRLFELAPVVETFLLYRSGAVEVAVFNEDFPGAGTPTLEAFAGNGAGREYARGRLGPTLQNGGDGRAEELFLETLAHVNEQITRQAELALEEDYDLVVLYSPVSDDVAHELTGYVTPSLESYDEGLADRLWDVLARGFGLQDALLGFVLDAAERDGAHVVLVSDHGMEGTDKLVHLNVALQRAGLLAITPDREIDLPGTKALALPLADASIAVNGTDRAGGIVSPDEHDEVLREVRRALRVLRDPDTDRPVVSGIYEPAKSGLLQPGGATTGDLFVDLAPGYYPSTSTAGDELVSHVEPRGNHIFPPTRRSMLAICALWGPRIPDGVNLGRVRAIDITPSLLDLLELGVPAALPGKSLVPDRGLLQIAR